MGHERRGHELQACSAVLVGAPPLLDLLQAAGVAGLAGGE